MADNLSRMFEVEDYLPVSPGLLQFPVLYENVGNQQRADQDLCLLIDRLS
jgi:hypothetical protein